MVNAGLEKWLAGVLKSNKVGQEFSIGIPDFCGILKTDAYSVYTTGYIRENRRELPDERFIDMQYPACWLKGADSIEEYEVARGFSDMYFKGDRNDEAGRRRPLLSSTLGLSMSHSSMTRFPNRKFAAVMLALGFVAQIPASAQNLSNLEKGREFLYCGKLVIHLLQTQGEIDRDPGKYKTQEKDAFTKMLMTSGAYIAADQIDAESIAADERLLKDIVAVSEKEATDKGATERLLKSRYEYCSEFEKKYALQAIERFAASSAARKASPSDKMK